MKKQKKCLKCEAYKLAAVGILAEVMGFPGFEFGPACQEIEGRMQHILTNLKRKNEQNKL